MPSASKQTKPVDAMAPLPLAGVRVLDLSRVFAGPQCAMILGDLGADVIKIEHHERGDDTRDWGIKVGSSETTYFNTMNRNKRSVTLNLDTAAGRDLLRQLVQHCDVLIHNFKRGDERKFGIAAQQVRSINPRMIYCSIGGYVSWGSENTRSGYDVVIQAEAGLMSINGGSTQPPMKVGVAVIDMLTGMYAAHAVLAALYQRNATGQGAVIEQALYDSGVMSTCSYALDALHLGRDPARYGNDHSSIVPYGLFQAADGPLIIAVGNNAQYRAFCLTILQCPALWEEPDYQTNQGRLARRDELIALLQTQLRLHCRDELISRMHAAGIPCGEVVGVHAAMTSKRTREAELVQMMPHPEVDEIAVIAPPYIMNGTRLPVRQRPPRPGEHNYAVLHEVLGLEHADVQQLIAQQAIAATPG